jgi:hypothetical protein
MICLFNDFAATSRNDFYSFILYKIGKIRASVVFVQPEKLDVSGYAIVKHFSHDYANVKSSKAFGPLLIPKAIKYLAWVVCIM